MNEPFTQVPNGKERYLLGASVMPEKATDGLGAARAPCEQRSVQTPFIHRFGFFHKNHFLASFQKLFSRTIFKESGSTYS